MTTHTPEATETGRESLDLAELHTANIARQAEWCPDQVPDLSFRGNELAGETGEACNVIKKLERERHGWRGSRATLDDLAQELADVVICADLCAVTAGIDLATAVIAKFNATSEKQGLSVFLRSPARTPPPPEAIPDTHVLVPREPEPEMLAAFWRIKNTGSTEPGETGDDTSDYAAYRAMIAAAPPAKTEG